MYQVLEETRALINDNHAFLEATDEVYETLEELYPVPEEENAEEEIGDFFIAQQVAEHHLMENLTSDFWLIQWGKLDDQTGFILIKAMWLYADLQLSDSLVEAKGYVDAYVHTFYQMNEGQYIQKEREGVGQIMDRVKTDLGDTKRMVIDLRFNGGGQDAVSQEILHRFNAQRLRIGTQQLRYGNNFSPPLAMYLDAHPTPYQKPVYLLISPQTGSAAEAFALATLAMDQVKRIGAPTQGALSTALEKKLPNGWAIALSDEIIRDNAGNIYENIGIPVDLDLGYPRDRQSFFRSVAKNLVKDKADIQKAIAELEQ